MPASGPPTRGARGWNMRCIQRAKPVPGTAPELAYSHDARQRSTRSCRRPAPPCRVSRAPARASPRPRPPRCPGLPQTLRGALNKNAQGRFRQNRAAPDPRRARPHLHAQVDVVERRVRARQARGAARRAPDALQASDEPPVRVRLGTPQLTRLGGGQGDVQPRQRALRLRPKPVRPRQCAAAGPGSAPATGQMAQTVAAARGHITLRAVHAGRRRGARGRRGGRGGEPRRGRSRRWSCLGSCERDAACPISTG